MSSSSRPVAVRNPPSVRCRTRLDASRSSALSRDVIGTPLRVDPSRRTRTVRSTPLSGGGGIVRDRSLVLVEHVERAILVVRGQKVLLDDDLAAVYGVPVKVLNQAAKRNQARFPVDFRFQLTAVEAARLRSHSVTLDVGGRGQHRKYLADGGASACALGLSPLSTRRATPQSPLQACPSQSAGVLSAGWPGVPGPGGARGRCASGRSGNGRVLPGASLTHLDPWL
jgi:hypothetical protein